jgi:AAA15 family ATPase/GTPase
MNLEAMKFCRFKGEKSEWSIEGKPQDGQSQQWLTLRDINLIVGKNATGKSRTIDAIRHIADLVSSDVKLSQLYASGFGTAEYYLKFSNDGEEIQYYLSFKEGKVIQESLTVGNVQKLNRAESKLYYEEINQDLDFQIDEDILAVTKRDKKQHSFFEDLYLWGKNLNHYRFGRQLGKDIFLKDVNAVKDDKDVDLKDGKDVASIFIKGKNEHLGKFVDTIIEDMKRLSYNLKEINASPLKYFPVSAFGLNVQENDLQDTTDQREMSQGMFRALSLLVQLNYSLLSKIPSCILIDDIGEGLDYDRSKGLIDLIIEKVKGSFVQVIMTTNDRFVMNKIPLDYWSVIERIPKKSLFYNYRNSKETFDEYKYSGLSNFDFLATDFYLTGFEKEESL